MLTKIFDILGIFALSTLLAAGGFAGYLFGTGRLNAARLETVARVLRGELDLPLSPVPAATSTQPVAEAPAAPRAATEEEIRQLRQRQHLESLQAERAARDLEAQRRLLDQVLQDVIQEQERLAAERAAVMKEQAAAEVGSKSKTAGAKKTDASGEDEGFQKELALVSELQPRQAKEHILRVWRKQPGVAVRLIREMDEGRVKRIFEQFKTPDELQVQSELLERVRELGTESYARSSGKTDGAAIP